MRDVRAQGSHREGDDVHRAALHAALEQPVERRAHLDGVTPVVGRTRVDLVRRADVGAVLDSRHVARVRDRVVAVGALGVRKPLKGPLIDEQLTEFVVLALGAVAPIDTIGGSELRHFFDPVNELLI